MRYKQPPSCIPLPCGHCLAYDNVTRALCSKTASEGSKWCDVHEELQAKLLKSYKRLTHAYEGFDDRSLPACLESVAGEESLETLQAWSAAARTKWSLARRVIVARAEHHQQFYAGGDWGHAKYVSTVALAQQNMELMLRVIEQRAYILTLQRSSAAWVLDLVDSPTLVCEDPPLRSTSSSSSRSGSPNRDSALVSPPRRESKTAKRHRRDTGPTSSCQSTHTTATDESNAAFFAALAPQAPTRDPHDLLKDLRQLLSPPQDLPSSVSPQLWTTFAESIFRIVVLRVPSLAVLVVNTEQADVHPCGCATATPCGDGRAAIADGVHTFLDSLERRLPGGDADDAHDSLVADAACSSLWEALQYAKRSPSEQQQQEGLVDVALFTDAIDALIRDEDDGGTALFVLGGIVWKDKRPQTWERSHWDLLYQLVGCAGCTLIATRDFHTWTTNRRLALLGRYPDWYSDFTEAEQIFRLSGMVLCTSNSCHAGRRVRRVEQKCKGCGGKGKHAKKVVHLEEWEAAWMFVKLPATGSAQILDYLAAQTQRYKVLARQIPTDAITHSPSRDSECIAGPRACSCLSGNELALARVRSGLTPMERKSAKWTTTAVLPKETILASLSKSSSPELRFHDAPYQDVVEAVVLDASPYSSPTHDSWLKFADQVAADVLLAQSYASFEDLRSAKLKEATDDGLLGAPPCSESPSGRDLFRS